MCPLIMLLELLEEWLRFLIITLSIPPDNTFTYVIARVFETFCGVFIAILVNYDYDWLLKHLK